MTNSDNNNLGKILAFIFMWAIVLTIILCSLAGCKTVYVPQPVYHEVHDTVVKKEVEEKVVIREVTVRDSVSFLVKGDTVVKERWHWERDYRYEQELQAKIDSLTKLKRDSVPYPVPGPVEYVPAQMTNMQIFYMTLGKVFLFILFLALIVILVKRRFFGIFKS
jgi:hypothetical protein